MSENKEIPLDFKLPSTRYQGSKRKLIPWIYENVKDLDFESAIDIFGGTGVISYLFKKMGKCVTYNDYLRFNAYIGEALIENDDVILSQNDLQFLLDFRESQDKEFVQHTFKGIYYTDEENRFIDCLVSNIGRLDNKYSGLLLKYKRAIAYYVLFQCCLIKRPFNLFHRNNLYLRTAEIPRSFGNKKTWDIPFGLLFQKFSEEINAAVFSNGKRNSVLNQTAFEIYDTNYDLVYMDPPYFSKTRTTHTTDYKRMYHFLEGLAYYDNWHNLIDYNSSNLRLKDNNNGWSKNSNLLSIFESLFERFVNSIIVLSYKSPGLPTEEEIGTALKKYKKNVKIMRKPYNYALNKSNGKKGENIELLIIGQ